MKGKKLWKELSRRKKNAHFKIAICFVSFIFNVLFKQIRTLFIFFLLFLCFSDSGVVVVIVGKMPIVSTAHTYVYKTVYSLYKLSFRWESVILRHCACVYVVCICTRIYADVLQYSSQWNMFTLYKIDILNEFSNRTQNGFKCLTTANKNVSPMDFRSKYFGKIPILKRVWKNTVVLR